MTKYQWELLKEYIKEATTSPLLRDYQKMYSLEDWLDQSFKKDEIE